MSAPNLLAHAKSMQTRKCLVSGMGKYWDSLTTL
jgi:hypothetical protein